MSHKMTPLSQGQVWRLHPPQRPLIHLRRTLMRPLRLCVCAGCLGRGEQVCRVGPNTCTRVQSAATNCCVAVWPCEMSTRCICRFTHSSRDPSAAIDSSATSSSSDNANLPWPAMSNVTSTLWRAWPKPFAAQLLPLLPSAAGQVNSRPCAQKECYCIAGSLHVAFPFSHQRHALLMAGLPQEQNTRGFALGERDLRTSESQ